MSKVSKIASVVISGAMLISSTIHAQEEIRTDYFRVFSQEALSGDKETYNEIEYYEVSVSGNTARVGLNPIRFTKLSDDEIVLRIEFDGAVIIDEFISTANSTSNLNIIDDSSVTGVGNIDWELISGGKKGDVEAVFLISGSGVLGPGQRIFVAHGDIGLQLNKPASLVVSMSSRDYSTVLPSKVIRWKDAYAIRQALTEKIEPINLLTSEDFMSFSDGSTSKLMASVGSITLGTDHPDPNSRITPEERERQTAFEALEGDIRDERYRNNEKILHHFIEGHTQNLIKNASQLIGIGGTKEDGSYFEFMGDFSFASKVTVDKTAACDTEGLPDLLIRDDNGNVTDTDNLKTWFVEESYVTEAAGSVDVEGPPIHLCIHVDGETPILDTEEPYTVTIKYAKPAGSGGVFIPEGETHELGGIERDGTEVHIPWVTTNERYNQRFTIVNRGPETDYTFTFVSDDGTTITPLRPPLGQATGPLPSNASVTLRAGDLVAIGDTRDNVSATLNIPGGSEHIDVSSTQVNLDTGDTDTVVYQ